ncbi:MAG: adenylate/guanylate cyclase domain-containing protein, partial [Spirochaeta sp.]|nr:adenylate/guanylate cyclase domain-containing protein [Spirochaeta sp.]
LNFGTAIPERLELKMLDVHFNMKNIFQAETVQEGVTFVQRNPDISDDILIVGIDSTTLSRFGRWPFPRYRHADLINSFARISDQTQRERSLFLDLFFIEPSDAVDDALLYDAMEQNERVYLETILEFSEPNPSNYDEFFERHERLFDASGRLTNVTGDWKGLPSFFGLQPPLQPFASSAGGYGHANLWDDFDSVYRRQPMVARLSERLDQFYFEDLEAGFAVDDANYERLVWFDRQGRDHAVDTPLTAAGLEELRAQLESDAPQLPVDEDGDGTADSYTFVLTHFSEQFIPSITLALALDYFNKDLEDAEIRIGEYIRIPDPQYFDTESGEWTDYRVLVEPAVYDENGGELEAAEYRNTDELVIPIDEHGTMLINYMGRRSSAARDGHQTFPVRPYYGYAARVPGPNPQEWPPTRAVENDIVMVGAFSQGMADDEKLTPYGLMYGVEVHANALNTILMDQFVRYAPSWMDIAILVGAALVVAFMSSRLSTIWAMLLTGVIIIAYFFTATILFDVRAFMVNFSSPALAMLLTFVSIVVYRVVTEEKDKRRIRDMFGKYVSPAVVSEILESPPELGGIDKDLTVFFSDIRGFTTLSESMTPQELVNHLNIYLTAMTDIILEYRGTLDKYVGDEVMCFWGAPLPQEDHAILACKSAIRQMDRLGELNAEWPPEKRIDIGIGLNSGIMTVGNMGSLGRMNYTLMGDNVNLGARLEGTNKQYATNIIISEYTYGLVKDRVIARELDNIRVKGKNKPVQIYELIDVPEGLQP